MRTTDKPLAYGNAVLSKFPIRWCETFPFGTRTMGEKGFMAADIDADGNTISLINLHLEYNSRQKRIEQIEMLIGMLESGKRPFPHPIICGDFNSSYKGERDAVHRLFTFMRTFDNYKLYPQKASTFPAHFPLRRLDFIMLPSRYCALHCHVVKSFISDHRPVIMDFEII